MLLPKSLLMFIYLYFKIINISGDEGISLAFAIDDTISMSYVIEEVKREAKEILEIALTAKSSEIKHYVLASINDPDSNLTKSTTSASVFQDELDRVRVSEYGNGDTEEMSLTGIQKALQASRVGSYLYVFTDASSKDYFLGEHVKNLCQKKQIQVVIVLTDYDESRTNQAYMVYHEIATACSGQVIHVPRGQVHTVLDIIKLMMRGRYTPTTQILLPASKKYLPVEFIIDEKTDYALVSTTGKDVNLEISTTNNINGPEPELKRMAWNEEYKVILVKNYRTGTYYAWAKGESTTSVNIYARTDFTFEHGFSTFLPTSLKETSKQPIAGTEQHLSFNITDTENAVDIQIAQILDMNENVYINKTLRKINNNFYVTDTFVSPSDMFKIAVFGIVKVSEEPIRRISRTPIQPMPPAPPPVPTTVPVVETENIKNVKYGSDITLACKVTAHPKPDIQWLTHHGYPMTSQSTVIEVPTYVSHAKISNVKDPQTYICKATNTMGSVTSKTTLNVLPVLIGHNNTEVFITVRYAEDVKIKCDIQSNLPISIRWFHLSNELASTRVHTISADRSVLTLKSMDIGMKGKYKCEAHVVSEPSLNKVQTTTVDISGLSSPEVTNSTTTLIGKNFAAICRIKGVPKPTISWQFQPKGSDVYQPLAGFEEVFNIPHVTLTHSGVYKCVAENALGVTERKLDLEVEEPPVITNDKNTFFGVEGDTVLIIPCNVTGFPDPVITWKKGNGAIKKDKKYNIKENTLYIMNPERKFDTGHVTCEAKNKKGTTVKVFEINVTVPNAAPVVKTDNSKNVKYGSDITLTCQVTAHPAPEIKWLTSDGYAMNAQSAVIEVPTYVSHINLSNIKTPQTFICNATNTMGSDTGTTTLNVLPIFIGPKNAEEFITVRYAEDVKIKCDIQSYLPISIRWFHLGNELASTRVHTISADRSVLTLKSMDIGMKGKYKCEAYVVSEPSLNKVQTTTVDISGLSAPAVNYSTTILSGKNFTAICRIKGVPKPTISWQFQPKGSDVYQPLAGFEEVFNIPHVTLTHSGVYKCVAENALGVTERKLDLEVEEPPVITNDKNTFFGVEGDTVLIIPCNVTGFPDPVITWKKGNGAIKKDKKYNIKGNTLYIINPERKFDTGHVTCEAKNKKGTTVKVFEINVTVPNAAPVVKTDNSKNVKYGSDITLTCQVTAHPAPEIKWLTSDGYAMNAQSAVIEVPTYVSHINLSNIKTPQTFICNATNTMGSDTGTTTLNVLPIFIGPKNAEEFITVRYAEDVKIKCDIQSYLPISIRWFHLGNELASTRVHTISADRSVLTLKAMDIGMKGKYKCEAYVVSEPSLSKVQTTTVDISGLSAPAVNYSTTILSGKNFTAICRIKGVPKPTISWQFQPKGSDVYQPLAGFEEVFNIPHVTLTHSGVYKCVAANALGVTERKLDLEVEEPPVITNDKNTFFGVEGDTVLIIPCNVTGFPDPVITWKKENGAIKKDNKYDIKGNMLYISNPNMESDTGNVTCEAKNKKGTTAKTFHIYVTDKFIEEDIYASVDSNFIDVDKDKSSVLNITCSLVKPGTSSVRWYMNGVKMEQTGAIYVINNPGVSDDGNYTCRVNTAEGPKSENYAIYVGYAPTFENNSPFSNISNTSNTLHIDWRNDEVLDCSDISKPKAKIEWTHNGKKLDSENNKPEYDVADWGLYTCTVSNVHGTIQRTFDVITSGCYLRDHMTTPNVPLLSQANLPLLPNNISNSDLVLNKHDKLKLSCPTTSRSANAFQMIPGKTEIIAECDTQDKFIVNGKSYGYKDLQCNASFEPSIVETSQRCLGPDTKILLVGFKVNGFLGLYNVCYDKTKNVPMYANAQTVLTISGNGVDRSKFKWIPSEGFGNGKLSGGYTCDISKKICCYEKHQLVDVDEMAFGPAQVATFAENLNSVAVWAPCNEELRTSWQNFESDVKSTYGTLPSWTGASNYEHKNGGLVPRYLWKVLNLDGAYTVMVYVNDKSPLPSDIKCTEPCDSIIADDEFLYCCTLDEFSKTFGIPSNEFVKSIG